MSIDADIDATRDSELFYSLSHPSPRPFVGPTYIGLLFLNTSVSEFQIRTYILPIRYRTEDACTYASFTPPLSC